ncbi:hypothetical protein RIR_jg17604.t1 [Rhizophagus irregularis DAOM 181602=DAOM 197198]|nr:hypothetical protein RIR_jg17604.t1 [Rhizophagus irregularis DAOM 181602=DAOM 197198]
MANASTDGITGLDAGGEVSNKSAISNVHSDLEIDKRDDELTLLDPLTLPLYLTIEALFSGYYLYNNSYFCRMQKLQAFIKDNKEVLN